MLTPFPQEIWLRLLSHMSAHSVQSLYRVSKTTRGRCSEAYDLTFLRPWRLRNALRLFPRVRRLTINDCTWCYKEDFLALRSLSDLIELTVTNLATMSNPNLFFEAIEGTNINLGVLKLDFESLASISIPKDVKRTIGEAVQDKENINLENGTSTRSQQNGASPVLMNYYHIQMLPSMSNIALLRNLQHLSMRNVPQCWNSVQTGAFTHFANLRFLELLFHYAPFNLDLLIPVANTLEELSLEIHQPAGGCMLYELPIEMPKLEKLRARNFGFSPTSIRRCIGKSITHLEFTPHAWHRSHMVIFKDFTRLEHLGITGLRLPRPQNLVSNLSHIKSLSLAYFRVEQCALLPYLVNLRSLRLESLLNAEGTCANPMQYGPIGEMLYGMPWLKCFSLDVQHLTNGIQCALAGMDSRLEALELSCCDRCIDEFAKSLGQCQHVPSLYSVAVRRGDAVLWWHARSGVWTILSRHAFQQSRFAH